MLGLVAAPLLSFIPALLFASIIYWLDRYEKEPLLLLGSVFVWGAFVASVGAIVAELVLEAGTGALLGSSELAGQIGASVYAPLIEETLKGLAVVIIYLLFHSEFDDLMDGLVYAGVVALGFAATENVLYLWSAFSKGGVSGMLGLWFVRVVLDGWGHPLYTAFIGIALAAARLRRGLGAHLILPLCGWLAAVSVHALFNTLAGVNLFLALLADWIGWVVIFVVIIFALIEEGRSISANLREEVAQGIITLAQYRTACSSWSQTRARWAALASGRYQVTARFYQICAELAQKKEQRARLGEEGGNTNRIEQLHAELARLAPLAVA